MVMLGLESVIRYLRFFADDKILTITLSIVPTVSPFFCVQNGSGSSVTSLAVVHLHAVLSCKKINIIVYKDIFTK